MTDSVTMFVMSTASFHTRRQTTTPLTTHCCDHCAIQDRPLQTSLHIPLASKFAGFKSGRIQKKVYQHRINNLDGLKHRLRAEWSNLDLVSSMASSFISLCENWRWTFRTPFL